MELATRFFLGNWVFTLLNLDITDKDKMFRGSSMRTGVSASMMPRKPSLLWVTEIGPTISSPIFANDTIFVSTITGRIFALNPYEKDI